MKTWLFRILAIAVLAGGGAFGWQYWRGEAEGGFDIQTTAAAAGEVRRVVSTSGAVRALVTVVVGSQLSGQITELMADFNSEVHAGQIVARIDPRTFAARVQQEEAAVAVAEASVALQQSTLTRAKATLQNATSAYERSQTLKKRGAVSDSALDSALADFQVAKADVSIAQAQLANARATLQQRRASLAAAQIDLERTYIRSPIDGVVVERSVDVGQTVAASMTAPTLFTIAQDLRQVRIDAQVDEADIGQVTVNDPVEFNVDAYPDKSFQGRIEQVRLAPVEDENVVTYTVVISAENPDKELLPGMTANVEIVVGERHDVLVVPNAALRFRPGTVLQHMVRDGGGAESGGSGRATRLVERLQGSLALTPEQVAAARTAVDQAIAAARAERNAGGEVDGRSAFGGRLEKALRGVLTAEQFARYQAMRQDRQRRRFAQLWVLESDRMLAPRRVQLGISDDRVTEIVGGELQPGEQVVTRARDTRG